jgi:IclR family KDG regulon transcriptional repressor
MDLKMKRNDDLVQSVIRAVSILDCFLGETSEYGLMELCRKLKLNKSTLHRLLSTLEATEYIRQKKNNGKYCLGIKALLLGLTAVDNLEINEFAYPHLQKLVDYSGETANLAILDEGKMVYICTIDSPKAIRMHTKIGQKVPVHSSAIGKVLLSGLTDAEIEEIVKRYGLSQRTPNTITDLDKLLVEVGKVRQSGYALDLEEDDEDMVCVAAKVVDKHGKIIAGISISGPKSRVLDKLDDFRVKVMEEAYRLSTKFGYNEKNNNYGG